MAGEGAFGNKHLEALQNIPGTEVVTLAGGVAGLYLSYYLPAVPSGAGIVLCCALPYLLARLFAPRR